MTTLNVNYSTPSSTTDMEFSYGINHTLWCTKTIFNDKLYNKSMISSDCGKSVFETNLGSLKAKIIYLKKNKVHICVNAYIYKTIKVM